LEKASFFLPRVFHRVSYAAAIAIEHPHSMMGLGRQAAGALVEQPDCFLVISAG
jgi:hypothetical protein